jgi:hypothetical protein
VGPKTKASLHKGTVLAKPLGRLTCNGSHRSGAILRMVAPGLSLVYRPDLEVLIARWQREISPAELKSGYEPVLASADEALCSRWLLDLRRREDVIEPVVNAWFTHEFAPSLRGRYVLPVRIAFLVSPLRAQQPVTAMVVASATDCQLATFTDEAHAYHWLGC